MKKRDDNDMKKSSFEYHPVVNNPFFEKFS